MYRILALAGGFTEICDECGFHAGLVDMDGAAGDFRGLGDRWAAVFSHGEPLVRARPEPDTWCPVEYAQHTVNAIASIEWAARHFARGETPDWMQVPADLPGRFDHPTHACEQFSLEATLDDLDAVSRSMADFARRLTTEQQLRTADYGRGLTLSTAAVVRHALHDAEHHLLDIRRGIARLQLSAD